MPNNSFLLYLLVLIVAFIIYLSRSQSKKTTNEISGRTYIEEIRTAQELDRAIKNFRMAYRKIAKENTSKQTEQSVFISEWNRLALEEVLSAKTLGELRGAGKLVFKGTLAARFFPLKHEELSLLEVEVAGYDIEKLIRAASRAPKRGEAERTAYAKLKRLLSHNR